MAKQNINHHPVARARWLMATSMGLVFCLMVFFGLASATKAGTTPPGDLDLSRIQWSKLSYSGSKFFFTATTDVELESLPAASVAPELITTKQGKAIPQQSGDTLVTILKSKMLNRESLVKLWFEPDMTALQRLVYETGSRNRHKYYRFTDIGAYRFQRKPSSESEEKLSVENWSNVSERLHPYPDAVTDNMVITEPAALFYIFGAANLSTPGDALTFHAFSGKRIYEVEIKAEALTRIAVDYTERSTENERQIEGTKEALKLVVRARPLDKGEDDDFEFLGLHGDIEVYIDPKTRAALRVSGRANVAGKVDIKLQRLVLK